MANSEPLFQSKKVHPDCLYYFPVRGRGGGSLLLAGPPGEEVEPAPAAATLLVVKWCTTTENEDKSMQ